MATKRVIAHFMHETERDYARPKFQSSEVTDSFVMGEIDDALLDDLRQHGLVIEELEAPPREMQADDEDAAADERELRSADPEMVTAGTGLTSNYYLLRLSGPLIAAWRASLEQIGVEILERVRGAYLARLGKRQVATVRDLDFVTSVRRYGQAETPVVSRPRGRKRRSLILPREGEVRDEPTAAAADEVEQERQYDILLHRPTDRPTVELWLAAKGVTIVGTGNSKIRISVAPGSTVPDEARGLRECAMVEEYVPPRFYNDIARQLLGLDLAQNPASPGDPPVAFPFEGVGQIVAVADTGLDDAHADFAGRVRRIFARGRPPNDHSDPNGHGTHVAGSAVGDGTASGGKFKGTAPRAELVFQSIMDASGKLGGLPIELGTMFEEAYQEGARIHNNSWGADTESFYRVTSREVDEFVARRRDMLIVIAAGNEGDSATDSPRVVKGNVDWLSIASPASSKNALVVGASRTSRTDGAYGALTHSAWDEFPFQKMCDEKISGDPDCLAGFSSRGPIVPDERIKPDVVAPGTDIVSTKSSLAPLRKFWGPVAGHPTYAYMGGTSMAAPLVAGCAALVREYYTTSRGHTPSAALLKATIINGARWLQGWDAQAEHPRRPNFHQGFGRVDMWNTIPTASRANFALEFADPWQQPVDHLREGSGHGRKRWTVEVNPNTPLRVCLAFTDLPGSGLQNILKLIVEEPNNPVKFVGNADAPHNNLKIPDARNNVQVVQVDQPVAGQYVIEVSVRTLLQAQDFALVVTGDIAGPLAPLP
jgi:serine protease AprX